MTVIIAFFMIFIIFANMTKVSDVAKKQNPKSSNNGNVSKATYAKPTNEFGEQNKANTQGASPVVHTSGNKSSGKTNINGKSIKVNSFERRRNNIVEDSQDRAYHGKLSRESRDDEKEWFK